MKPKESKRYSELGLVQFAENTPVYTLEELIEHYGAKSSRRTICNLLYRLSQQGRVKKISRGVYAGRGPLTGAFSPFLLASKLKSDAVIGYHSALEFLGHANQVFRTVYYLSAHYRKPVEYEGFKYHCVTLPHSLLETHKNNLLIRKHRVGNSELACTDRERAIVDCLHRLEYSGGLEELDQILAGIPSLDFSALVEYLKALHSRWLWARVGYMLDRHREALFFKDRWQKEFLRHLPPAHAYLTPDRKSCRLVKKWHILIPVSLPLQPGTR